MIKLEHSMERFLDDKVWIQDRASSNRVMDLFASLDGLICCSNASCTFTVDLKIQHLTEHLHTYSEIQNFALAKHYNAVTQEMVCIILVVFVFVTQLRCLYGWLPLCIGAHCFVLFFSVNSVFRCGTRRSITRDEINVIINIRETLPVDSFPIFLTSSMELLNILVDGAFTFAHTVKRQRNGKCRLDTPLTGKFLSKVRSLCNRMDKLYLLSDEEKQRLFFILQFAHHRDFVD